MMHVIGNSHVSVFANTNEIVPFWYEPRGQGDNTIFKTYRLGPTTAYSFTDKYWPEIERILFNINKTENISLCVGEVDCRYHLPQRIMDGANIYSIINECAQRFFQTALRIRALQYSVTIWGVHPSIAEECHNEITPAYGTRQFRNYVTRLWNNTIERMCLTMGVHFIPIFSDLIIDGHANQYFYRDYCHLNNRVFPILVEKLEREGLRT